jgi:hypothetical protein
MGLRNWLKKLERGAREDLVTFPLEDGTRYYYAPGPAIFLFCYDCIGKNPHDWPEPPEVLTKITEARDPAAAFAEVMGGSTDSFIYDDIFPYNPEVLVDERRLVPRSLDPGGGNPYEEVLDDLSE